MRMTEQRRVIARVLAASADHPDVEELYRRCAAVDNRISISTVYRTVKLFEDAGIIERHDFRDGARATSRSDNHHDHLIDLRTGEVIEFRSEEIEELQAEVARRLGYRLVDHRLELYAVPLDREVEALECLGTCRFISFGSGNIFPGVRASQNSSATTSWRSDRRELVR